MSKKRGRDLVAMCNNGNRGYNDDEIVSTHGHFNEEPLSYEWSRNDPSHAGVECIDVSTNENVRIEEFGAENRCEPEVEDESPDLIQLVDLLNVHEGSSQISNYTEHLQTMVYEKTCYGDIIMEQTDDGQGNIIQVLDSTPDVRIEYNDNQISGNNSPARNLVEIPFEIQNNTEAEEWVVLQPAEAVNEIEDVQIEQVSRKENKKSRKRKINKSEWKFEKIKKARELFSCIPINILKILCLLLINVLASGRVCRYRFIENNLI